MIGFCADIAGGTRPGKKAIKTGASKITLITSGRIRARFHFPHAPCRGDLRGHTSLAPPSRARSRQRMVEESPERKKPSHRHGATGKGNDQVRFELTAARSRPTCSHRPVARRSYRTNFPSPGE